MIVLGVNAYHGDASACLLRDGNIVAAAEEERFRRVKHWAGFPTEAVRFCLREAGLPLASIEHVAVGGDPRINLARRLGHVLLRRPHPALWLDRLLNQRRRSSVAAELEAAFPAQRFQGRVHRVEHHLAHMASTFLASPFEEAATVSLDGFGDFASAAWGLGRNGAITIDRRIWFPHSLGVFYQAITQYLGFRDYGDEYKVMGLAPYGQPSRMREMRRIVQLGRDGAFALSLGYFRHHREKIDYRWSHGRPEVGALYSPMLEDLLGPARRADEALDRRHCDIACSAQAMYEEALFHLLGALYEKYRCANLALAGGCALNSAANGKIRLATPFERLYVPPAAGDAGVALGAALFVRRALGDDSAAGRSGMRRADFGPAYDDAAIAALLTAQRAALSAAGCLAEHIGDEAALCARTAEAIAHGQVVGWFQGRMEWGPRALGNRSIICDPRRAEMGAILNLKIKRRENFRPFAPAILRASVADWFEEDVDVPFMNQVVRIRAEKRAAIPAVTHVDGTGRLQTVSVSDNSRFHRLIEAFRDLTGIPIVLNTSFNENEPIVCAPEEALACFSRTGMDILVMGNWFLRRIG